MNKKILDAIPVIVEKLSKTQPCKQAAFLGFDACIDNIVRVVRNNDEENVAPFYLRYLLERTKWNCTLLF